MYEQPALLDLPPTPEPHPSGSGYLPQWLAAEIRARHPNTQNRTATWTHCDKCDAIILTGIDADLVAGNATVDPTPLTDAQEIAAALTGRRTYNIDHNGPGARLHYRTHWEMRTPPSRHQQATLPEHRCGRRFPGFLVPPETTPADNENPPF